MAEPEQHVPGLKRFFNAFLTLPRLMTARDRDKLKQYDALVENLKGLQNALDTQQRALDEAHRQLDANREQVEKLHAEYARLEQRAAQMAESSGVATLQDMFRRLQPAAVQLPTIRTFVADGADISARDVLAVIAPLEQMLRDLGFEPIGEANGKLPFDPRLHQVTGPQAPPVEGESVQVRYVGYRYKGQVLCKAQVTRLEQPQSV